MASSNAVSTNQILSAIPVLPYPSDASAQDVKANDANVDARHYVSLDLRQTSLETSGAPKVRPGILKNGYKPFDIWMLLGDLNKSDLETYMASNRLAVTSTRQLSTLAASQFKSEEAKGVIAITGACFSAVLSTGFNAMGARKSFNGGMKHQASVRKTQLAHREADEKLKGGVVGKGVIYTSDLHAKDIRTANFDHDVVGSKSRTMQLHGEVIGRSSTVSTSLTEGTQHVLSAQEQAQQTVDASNAQITTQIMQTASTNRSTSEEQARQDANCRTQIIQADTSVIDHVASATRI